MFTVNGGSIQQNAALNDALTTTSTAASATTTTPLGSQQASSVGSSCAAAESCPSHVGAYAGLGAGLGIPLLLALIALSLLFLQLRKYKKQNQPISSHNENKQYMQHPPSMANNSYGSGYHSLTPPHNPPTHLQAELPSGANDQRTGLPASLGQK
ncbi:hypothetical protein LTR70_009336 [Exophiala xenobiotica]|uniref:Uncharacterized protein n=1 Tax=Lithohypha guttulata TaxID=1690604 RepID=A0ABR0K0A0_9EURO|nr:hypothetical protein LTR24_008346 [Lithohypha guttulata]KAK5310651.1 hypothetical protein LTR70_009336 [Exophiala xenobiotica]